MNALALAASDVSAMEGYGGSAMPEPEPQYQEWTLDKKVRSFEDSEEASDAARQSSEKCRDYYDNKQLTATEKAALALRGQPDIIINRIQSKVNYLLGYEASLRTDPVGRPRTPEDEEAAEACTDGLNYVRDTSDQKQAFSQCWENMLIEGSGGSEVVPTLKPGDADIKIKKVHWDRAFADPHSREHDYSDARYLGQVIWMDHDDAIAQWPDAAEAFAKTISDDAKLTYSDRPRWRQWATAGNSRKRIRIVQMYYKCRSTDGKDECWHWCIFSKGGEIEGGIVPYRSDDNESLCPLVLQSCFVDRENNRYGFVQALLGPQDEINKRRSKMLHLAVGKPFTYEEGAIDDIDLAEKNLASGKGIKLNPGFKFELLDNSRELAAHAGLQTEAKNEIELMGPNAAMLGKGPDASGRSKLVDQQGGQIEIAIMIDRHNHYKARIHRLVWAMIKLYWREEKWIRVTDDEDNVRFVGFNRPVTLAEELLKEAAKQGIPEDEAKAKLRDAAQDPQLAAQLQQVVKNEHVPADMGMDIILEEIPDMANIQAEQFAVLGDLAAKMPPTPQLFKLVLKASNLRNKKELLEEMDKADQEAKADPLAQAQQQIQIEAATTEIEKLKAEIAKISGEISKAAAETNKIAAEARNADADSVKKLAEADALDQQIGSVIDPEIVSADGSVTPAKETPHPMPTPQNPMVQQAISQHAAGMSGGQHQMPDGAMMDDAAMPPDQGQMPPPDQFSQPQQAGF